MSELRGKVIEVRPSLDAGAATKVGQLLKEMRRLSGLTQANLASRLRVSRASISRAENGLGDLQIPTIRKFVEALGCSLRVTTSLPAGSTLSLRVLDAFEDELLLSNFSDRAYLPHRDVIVSIRPQYSNRIMTGEKTVELRRRFPASAPRGTILYIYSSSPQRAMVGHAKIDGVHKLALDEIWRRYADVACVERLDFDSYFDGLEQGYAVKLTNVHSFEPPVSLSLLRKCFKFEPPQSFQYVKQDLRRILNDEHSIVSH